MSKIEDLRQLCREIDDMFAEGSGAKEAAQFILDSATGLPNEKEILERWPWLKRKRRIINVPAGGDFQGAINEARLGDTIVLEAGARFTGCFTFPYKDTGEGCVCIKSSKSDDLKAGRRVLPTDVPWMAAIVSPNEYYPAIVVKQGAKNYCFKGLEITTDFNEQSTVQYGLMRIGWTEEGWDLTRPATGITIDRCYIHGTTTGNVRDGIVAYNVKGLTILDSYIDEIHGIGYESHGIHIYSGSDIHIASNTIVAAGINLFIGDNDLGGLTVPKDIEITGNHLYKPWSWKPDHAEYAGVPWLVKNILEIKAALDVYIDGNTMENVWVGGQHGQVIVITPRGGYIDDVVISENVMRNFDNGIAISSADVSANGITLDNNFIYGANTTDALLITISGTPGQLKNVNIIHNTLAGGKGGIFFNGALADEVDSLSVVDNIFFVHPYAIMGNGRSVGLPSVEWFCGNYLFQRNAFIGTDSSWYTVGPNFKEHLFFDSLEAAGVSPSNFTLLPNSPLIDAGSDGTDLGAVGIVSNLL